MKVYIVVINDEGHAGDNDDDHINTNKNDNSIIH